MYCTLLNKRITARADDNDIIFQNDFRKGRSSEDNLQSFTRINLKKGIVHGGEHVSVLSYADGVVLIAAKEQDLQGILD